MKKIVASLVGAGLLCTLALELPASATSRSSKVDRASDRSSVNTHELLAKKGKYHKKGHKHKSKKR